MPAGEALTVCDSVFDETVVARGVDAGGGTVNKVK